MIKSALISMGSVSSRWIAKAMAKYFDQVDEIKLKEIEINLTPKGAEVLHEGKPIKQYDCVYAKGSFRYSAVLRSLTTALCTSTYMPVKASTFTTAQDKLLTQLKLQQSKISMPQTYLAASPEGGKKILEKMNYPIIMKFPSGTQGKGVMFADSYPSASSMLDALTSLNQPFLIQEYVETGGVDTRVMVVGGKVIASMKRKAQKGEKRANLHAGGEGEACELDFNSIAIKTAEVLGAEICGVDLIEGLKGPMVLEVNLSPGLQGITSVTKIDIADYMARHLYQQTKLSKNSGLVKEAGEVLYDLGITTKGEDQQIISNLDFRAERILLPKIMTSIAKFTEKDEVILQAKEGQIQINRLVKRRKVGI